MVVVVVADLFELEGKFVSAGVGLGRLVEPVMPMLAVTLEVGTASGESSIVTSTTRSRIRYDAYTLYACYLCIDMLLMKDYIVQIIFLQIIKISALVFQYGGGGLMKHFFFL